MLLQEHIEGTAMTNMTAKIFSLLIGLGLLAACTTTPTGPSVLVLPGTGKSFDQFRSDDFECRNFAFNQIGGATAANTAANSGVTSAAVGTVVGAAAGAAIGGSHGAGVGAGTGLAFGSLAGTGAANESVSNAQQRYDFGYEQCMYAKGHRIPVYGSYSSGQHMQSSGSSGPSGGSFYPPPPPPPSR
jgi:hypothetical protein